VARVKKLLKKEPALSWDQAVAEVLSKLSAALLLAGTIPPPVDATTIYSIVLQARKQGQNPRGKDDGTSL
jgi:hypothetical protein